MTANITNPPDVSSKTDVAVALLETLIDGCVDRETLRKKFMEKFGGDRHAARTYFNLALRRLVNAGKVAVTKSGGSEVICRSGELTEVIKKWGDLIDVLTWRSESRVIYPDVKTNGRIITYLVRHGMLKTLAASLCRRANVWAYVDDPVDLSLVLAALQYVTSRNGSAECRCPNLEVALLVPRRAFLMYIAITATVENDTYVLRLPGGLTTSLKRIETDCSQPLHLALFGEDILHLIIRFVQIVD